MPTFSKCSTYFVLCGFALAHFGITLLYALTRIYSYKASLLDIGLFDQLLWNLQHFGTAVTTATLPFTSQHWLGFHFSPLLFGFLPIYSLWPHIETFQVIQSLCFALAGIPLFFAISALGTRPLLALAGALLYWTNPLVLSAAIWDFHEIALSTLFISLALYALCAERFRLMLGALALLVLTKEHYGVAVAGFGFLWGWHYSDWKRGTLLMLAGFIITFCILKIIMPYFSGGAHPMFSDEGNVISRYGWLAASWPEQITRFLGLMFGDGTPQITGMLHLFMLLLSGLLFPLLAPLYLAPAAADIAANLLSANPMPRHIASYHAAACVPVFIVAGTKGFMLAEIKLAGARKLLTATALIVATIMPVSGMNTLPFSVWELSAPILHKDQKSIDDISSIIGDAPIAAQANIGMFFSQRTAIYPFPHMLEKSEFIVLHLQHPFADTSRSNFNIPYGTDTEIFAKNVADTLQKPDWNIVYWQRPWLVLKRGERIANTHRDAEIEQSLKALTSEPNL